MWLFYCFRTFVVCLLQCLNKWKLVLTRFLLWKKTLLIEFMYEGCPVNISTDFITKQLWEMNINFLYFFFLRSSLPLQHIYPIRLQASVFWQHRILLADLWTIWEPSSIGSQPSWKHSHHSDTDELATLCSPNTHDGRRWTSADFESLGTRNFIPTCFSLLESTSLMLFWKLMHWKTADMCDFNHKVSNI